MNETIYLSAELIGKWEYHDSNGNVTVQEEPYQFQYTPSDEVDYVVSANSIVSYRYAIGWSSPLYYKFYGWSHQLQNTSRVPEFWISMSASSFIGGSKNIMLQDIDGNIHNMATIPGQTGPSDNFWSGVWWWDGENTFYLAKANYGVDSSGVVHYNYRLSSDSSITTTFDPTLNVWYVAISNEGDIIVPNGVEITFGTDYEQYKTSLGQIFKFNPAGLDYTVDWVSPTTNIFKISTEHILDARFNQPLFGLEDYPAQAYQLNNYSDTFSITIGYDSEVQAIVWKLIVSDQITESVWKLQAILDGGPFVMIGEREISLRSYGPYTPGGISGVGGGKGRYDGGSFGDPSTSDDISSELPTTSTFADASSSGTYTKYLVNNAYLEVFGDWLWNTSFGLAIAQEVIKLIYGDPSESIISLMAYPFQLNGINGISYEQRDFYWGNHNAGFQVPALTSTSGQINWGTLEFDEYWGNFLDYSPHTKIQLYLPWGTGFVDINPDEVLPGTMTVVTTVELDKGSCVHNVFNHMGNVIGSYSGQCGKHVALMSSDFSSKLANIAVTAVSAGVTLGSGVVSGGVSKMLTDSGKIMSYQVGFRGNVYDLQFQGGGRAFASGAKESIPSSIKSATHAAKTSLAANKTPTHVNRNGSFTDSSAGLGIQFPYVILSRPTQSVPDQYGSYEGYPSNIYAQLRTIKGYTEISEIHLKNFENATVDEINKLEELLKGGVIF